MGFTLNQITPARLLENRLDMNRYLQAEFSPLIGRKSWMQNWEQLAKKFQLFKFEALSAERLPEYSWNPEEIAAIADETCKAAMRQLHFKSLSITIVPSLPFPWFQNIDQSLWTNGYTIGPDTIFLAIPPQPDPDFLKYMLAHELHHACPENPIYNLTLETFTLADWYKMEGCAEYFSLSLYRDKRWWKESFTEEAEHRYLEIARQNLHTEDDVLKSKICFGDKEMGIPIFSGYSFAFKMVRHYAEQEKITRYRDLFHIDPVELLNRYMIKEDM
ncbi:MULTISPECIES: DUF2268 domain-containing putative Zn-dependent protease [unclassified Cytobacillus]|uniref:DUF2268 domain-containing putative Zn-dependent protease n=1 Tax=unclassified Cytobacillus TaxID=2675268 RepID=UPI00203AA5BB|nr:DUF2268 domain-containing putative Zn-dependent protease [Cytobacillus sp. AMY 15.2]MCM3090598.1 DUF2268 domain-containing protein [Cytobacillus sp. AMY 15.2]